uniref:Uncharacterized protein n=1 Tax=Glossina pallidipes TaxID=7398 RepID=A0A1A9ZCN0_GLOPL
MVAKVSPVTVGSDLVGEALDAERSRTRTQSQLLTKWVRIDVERPSISTVASISICTSTSKSITKLSQFALGTNLEPTLPLYQPRFLTHEAALGNRMYDDMLRIQVSVQAKIIGFIDNAVVIVAKHIDNIVSVEENTINIT